MIKRVLTSKWLQCVLMIGLVLFLTATSYIQFEYRQKIRYFAFDTLNRLDPRAASHEVVIVDIDEETLRRYGQWPFPRTVLADLVKKMKDYGVKVTAFDMVFAEEDRTSPHLVTGDKDATNNDDIFAKAIEDAGNVVTGFVTAREEETRRLPFISQPVMIRPADRKILQQSVFPIAGAATNIPVIAEAAAGNGIFLATPSSDGIIREIPVMVNLKGTLYPSLAIEALRVAGNPKEGLKIGDSSQNKFRDHQLFSSWGLKDYILKIGEGGLSTPFQRSGKFRVKFREMDRATDYFSAYKILDPQFSDEAKHRLGGKIAFVGTSAEALKDIRSTPLDVFIPGVEVHANVVEQILQQDFLSYDPWLAENMERLAIVVLGLCFIALSFFIGVLSLTFMMVSVTGLAAFASYYAYVGYGFLFDPLYPSLCLSVIFMATVILNYLRTESQAKEIRSAFGLYISPEFMKELTEHPEKLKLGGEQKELTVMFTDIRNFTSLSESLSPEELILTMNDFLTPMSDVVMGKRGTIDKYMGDAMMAFWNAPLDDTDHAKHAVEAALKMRSVLDPVNRQLADRAKRQGRQPITLAAGIGINTGVCSVGNMGSKQRFAYSALGDAVNLASRLEGQTKSYGLDLLIGEEAARQVRDFALIEIDKIRVKGKEEAIRIFTVLGDDALGKKTSFRRFKIKQKQFLRAYRRMQWKDAMHLLAELDQDHHASLLHAYYQMMLNRMRDHALNAVLPADWDGVYTAKDK